MKILEKFDENMAKDFVKMFPKYKIPYLGEFKYYLETQSKIYSNLETELEMYYNSFSNYDKEKYLSYKDYKYSFMNKVVSIFKEEGNLEKLNSLELPVHNYSLKENKNYIEDKIYVSLDLVSANFQVLNKYVLNGRFSSYKDFLKQYTNDECLMASKSVRQFIFGNLNPKRTINLQKYEMSQIELKLTPKYIGKIFSKNSDEIVLELDTHEELNEFLEFCNTNTLSLLNINFTSYKINYVNCVDKVMVKTKLSGEKEIIYGRGDRFFLNLPSILPSHKYDERDAYFTNEGMLAKWL